jgi:hypothetical protein
MNRSNPKQGLNARLKKKSACYKDYGVAYGEYAAKLKAIDTKMINLKVIMLILKDTDLTQRMSSAYKSLSTEIVQETDSDISEYKLAHYKNYNEEMESEFDLTRVILNHTINKDFPTLEDVKKEDAEEKKNPGKASESEDKDKGKDKEKEGSSTESSNKPYRMWSDKDGGHQIRAQYIGKDGNKVKLKKENGKIIKVPLNKLSDADQSYVNRQDE